MIIRTIEELKQCVVKWNKCKLVAVDTETRATKEYPPLGKKDALILDRARLEIITVCTSLRSELVTDPSTGEEKRVYLDAWTIPCRDFISEDSDKCLKGLPLGRVFRVLRPWFLNRRSIKIFHNANYDLNVFANYDVKIRGYRDTMLEAGMVNENIPKGLKDRNVLLGRVMRKPGLVNFQDVEDIAEYGEEDVIGTFALAQVHDRGTFDDQAHFKEVITDNLTSFQLSGYSREWYESVELPVLDSVISMERRGFLIDREHFARQFDKAVAEIDQLERKIYRTAGYEFNLNSTPQKRKFIFDELNLDPHKKTKTGPSLDDESLYMMQGQHPVILDMIEYKNLKTLASRYLNPDTGIPAYADHQGFIHATSHTMGAKTSRFSVGLPALQQMPKGDEFDIRSGFIARPGYCIIRIDYSQIEIRLIATWTGDPTMIAALQEGDIHQATQDRLGLTDRRVAKTVNFGLFYGLGPWKLAMNLTRAGVPTTTTQAKAIIKNFYATYSHVNTGFDHLFKYHRKHGFVHTICGRKRSVPHMDSPVPRLRMEAERMLRNNIPQASVADLIKLSMLRCDRDPDLLRWDCRMLLQVHDELLFECPKKYARVAARKIKHLMEAEPETGTVVDIPVPILADPEIRPSWGGAELPPLQVSL